MIPHSPVPKGRFNDRFLLAAFIVFAIAGYTTIFVGVSNGAQYAAGAVLPQVFSRGQ
jgi:hypothetical protein